MTTKSIKCPWCSRALPDDAGAFYHRQECRCADVLRRIEEARERGAAPAEIERLDQELDSARYVGD